MRIIVAGAGTIGYPMTKMLAAKKHDVVVIDRDRDVCEEIYADTGAMAIHGSATDIQILIDAGVPKADVVLCLLRSDGANIALTALTKSLGDESLNIIALARRAGYGRAYKSAGATNVVRLADLLLNQIMLEIEQPQIREITALGGGRAEVYAIKVPHGARSVGVSIAEIARHKNFPQECVFVGIYDEEKNKFSIPRGEHRFQGGETIFLASNRQYIKQATDFLIQM